MKGNVDYWAYAQRQEIRRVEMKEELIMPTY